MKTFGRAIATVAMSATGGLGLAETAAAMPSGNDSAADTVAKLEAEGYHVQLNGSANVPLSLCEVAGVHGLRNSNIDSSGSRIDEDLYTTVYVDVRCQDG
jgi:hypothetical protein